MTGNATIVWFRRDLRLTDNPALLAAVQSGRPVVAAFILDQRERYCWDNGGASRWWLHHSLESLALSLQKLGGSLVLRRGDSVREMARLIDDSGAVELHYARGSGPEADLLERQVDKHLAERIDIHRHCGHLLYEPGTLRTTSGGPYKIFTAFWRASRQLPDPHSPQRAPGAVTFLAAPPVSDRLRDWKLTPSSPDWAGGLRHAWTPGERGAAERTRVLIEGIHRYPEMRQRPDRDATSRLSPHLHFGEVSPRQLWHDVHAMCDPADAGATAWLRQIGWREFCHHLLHEFPELPQRPLRTEFERFPWKSDRDVLVAWQQGRTGYPIVDAGMRELINTGWMHNRVRMIAASLLVKHLLIPWQDGAAWFQETLVDADEANNSANWQWVAGCGTDAAPYFRIFNPVLQARKFDPDGRYIRRWVPELQSLQIGSIHAPWEAAAGELRKSGIVPGQTYPAPLVDHRTGRQRALEAFRHIRSG